MTGQPDITHRLFEDAALCGAQGTTLTPHDGAVSCPLCRALIELAERRRRTLVRRTMVVLGKVATA